MRQAGKMRSRVILQKPDGVRDGNGEPSGDFVFFARPWVRIFTKGGDEREAGDQIHEDSRIVVEMDYMANVTADLQVLHRGRTLHVNGVDNVDEADHTLRLHCREVE